jgi:2-hydroxychromene-2-carboxylate isomerase
MGELINLAQRRAACATAERPTGGCPPPSTPSVFYFDLDCPFSYLALERVERLFAGAHWRPTLADCLDPSDPRADEATADGARATAERRARELGLPLIWPAPGRGARRATRTAVYAAEQGRGAQFALAAGRLAFSGGFDLDDPEILAEAATAACISVHGALRAAADERLDGTLEEAGRRLRAAGATRLPAIQTGQILHCGEQNIGQAAATLRATANRVDGAA